MVKVLVGLYDGIYLSLLSILKFGNEDDALYVWPSIVLKLTFLVLWFDSYIAGCYSNEFFWGLSWRFDRERYASLIDMSLLISCYLYDYFEAEDDPMFWYILRRSWLKDGPCREARFSGIIPGSLVDLSFIVRYEMPAESAMFNSGKKEAFLRA